MDRESHLIVCATCNTEIHLGDGMCPRCGSLDPAIVLRGETDAELHRVGQRD